MGFPAQAHHLHTDFCLCSVCFGPAEQDLNCETIVKPKILAQLSRSLLSSCLNLLYLLHILKIMQLQ